MTPRQWIEVRFTATGLELEAVPEVPTVVAWTGGALPDFAATLRLVAKKRDVQTNGPVDVLVDRDTDVQRLVDVLVALDAAGARRIGLGWHPDSPAAKLRGRRYPIARLHDPIGGRPRRTVIRSSSSRGATRSLRACSRPPPQADAGEMELTSSTNRCRRAAGT
jgi:hypothetical protein